MLGMTKPSGRGNLNSLSNSSMLSLLVWSYRERSATVDAGGGGNLGSGDVLHIGGGDASRS
jgi:hypothetical protein